MKKYQNIEFKQRYTIKLIEKFFNEFPEERRGRRKFKEKEIQNIKHLIYEKIFQKGKKVNADCIGSIREKVDKDLQKDVYILGPGDEIAIEIIG